MTAIPLVEYHQLMRCCRQNNYNLQALAPTPHKSAKAVHDSGVAIITGNISVLSKLVQRLKPNEAGDFPLSQQDIDDMQGTILLNTAWEAKYPTTAGMGKPAQEEAYKAGFAIGDTIATLRRILGYIKHKDDV